MKSYVDIEYYTSKFYGEKLIKNHVELKEKLLLASSKIDDVTYNRIVKTGFNNLTKFQQDKVKDAVCFQANYIVENGLDNDDIISYSVLDINVSVSNKETIASKLGLSEMTYASLKPTGLMKRIL